MDAMTDHAYAVSSKLRSHLPETLVACGLAAAGLIAAGLGAARSFWPTAQIPLTASGSALARVELAPFGERVTTATVLTHSGQSVTASPPALLA